MIKLLNWKVGQKHTMLMIVALWSTVTVSGHEHWHNILSYGAVSDTNELSTSGIQAAIDSCYFQGGGTVYVPSGNYLSGTIVMKDNVTLFLEAGATIYASRNINDYRMPLEDALRPVLIYANGAKNISFKGKGVLHGKAVRKYKDLKKTDRFIKDYTENAKNAGVEMKRYYIVQPDVNLVTLTDCYNVLVEDISLIESSFWTLHIALSERIVIRGVYIYSSLEKGVNADGIDINSCRDMIITDCIIKTGDDGIVLKTRYEKPCENIVVSNCIVTSSSTALKLGTESHADFRHILFTDCVVRDANRGLSIVVRDGALVEDVIFSDITLECKRRHFNWWGNGDPIWIFLTKRNKNSRVGYVKNVQFNNIIANGMGTSKIESTEGKRIENIQLNNVQLTMVAEDQIDKRADDALYVDNTNGLVINNLDINWNQKISEPKWRSALAIEDAEDVRISGITCSQGLPDSDAPVIRFVNAKQVYLNQAFAEMHTNTFIDISGERSMNFQLQNIDPFDVSATKIIVSQDVRNKDSISMPKK